MNKQSDQYFLELLLSPWIGLADDDASIVKYRFVDPNNEPQVKSIVLSDLGPHVAGLDPECRNRIKHSLLKAIRTDQIDLGRFFDALLPPFDHPKDPRDIFRWILEVIYPE